MNCGKPRAPGAPILPHRLHAFVTVPRCSSCNQDGGDLRTIAFAAECDPLHVLRRARRNNGGGSQGRRYRGQARWLGSRLPPSRGRSPPRHASVTTSHPQGVLRRHASLRGSQLRRDQAPPSTRPVAAAPARASTRWSFVAERCPGCSAVSYECDPLEGHRDVLTRFLRPPFSDRGNYLALTTSARQAVLAREAKIADRNIIDTSSTTSIIIRRWISSRRAGRQKHYRPVPVAESRIS